MPTPKLDVELHRKILDLHKQGIPERKIAKMLHVASGTVSNYKNITLPVKSDKKRGEFNWRDVADRETARQVAKRKQSWTQDRAVIELGDGKTPICLASFSDTHIGAGGTDYQAFVAMTDELLNTPNLYIALLGDYAEYAVRLRSVAEVVSQGLSIEEQTDFIESWFEDIWHKVAFATFDNHHNDRSEQLVGESSLKRIMSRKVVYFNGIGHVDLKVGEQVYKGCVSHVFRGRSMHNPVHAIQRYMRFEGTDREWGMAGDSHVPGMLAYTDGDKTRVAVNAGTLHANSSYAKRYFSLCSHPVFPVVVFYPDEHRMQPFWSVRDWLAAKK